MGVAHPTCGVLGKKANWQVAVTLSVANRTASVPVAFRLYLPAAWADDPGRRERVLVPEDTVFITKWQIALTRIDAMVAKGVPQAPVLAGAGYGDNTAFQDGLTRQGLR